MTMSLDVSMRDLRNHTKQVVERIEDGTTMYLTKNGERIATITPLRPKTWADHVDDVLGGERGQRAPDVCAVAPEQVAERLFAQLCTRRQALFRYGGGDRGGDRLLGTARLIRNPMFQHSQIHSG